jgi:ferritin-like metal-binding protein YciE
MSAELDLLRRRYVQKLDDLYGSEMENVNVLPEMAEVAHSPALKSAFQYHYEKTQAHVERLDQIFAGLSIRPINLRHQETKALVREVQRLPITTGESVECDALLISAARKMEYYEIFGYLLALRYAQILREHTAASLLDQTLKEEYEAVQILAELEASGSGRAGDRVEYGNALYLVRH